MEWLTKQDLCALRSLDNYMNEHITELQLLNLHSDKWLDTTLDNFFSISEHNISILKEVRTAPAVRCSYLSAIHTFYLFSLQVMYEHNIKAAGSFPMQAVFVLYDMLEGSDIDFYVETILAQDEIIQFFLLNEYKKLEREHQYIPMANTVEKVTTMYLWGQSVQIILTTTTIEACINAFDFVACQVTLSVTKSTTEATENNDMKNVFSWRLGSFSESKKTARGIFQNKMYVTNTKQLALENIMSTTEEMTQPTFQRNIPPGWIPCTTWEQCTRNSACRALFSAAIRFEKYHLRNFKFDVVDGVAWSDASNSTRGWMKFMEEWCDNMHIVPLFYHRRTPTRQHDHLIVYRFGRLPAQELFPRV
jgi:hypothetical protein